MRRKRYQCLTGDIKDAVNNRECAVPSLCSVCITVLSTVARLTNTTPTA